MKKAKEPVYGFYMLKTHTHMQIPYKPVVQACRDFKIFTHISKGKESFVGVTYVVTNTSFFNAGIKSNLWKRR